MGRSSCSSQFRLSLKSSLLQGLEYGKLFSIYALMLVSDTSQRDKKFYRPAGLKGWVLVVFERPARFDERAAQNVARLLSDACNAVGASLL